MEHCPSVGIGPQSRVILPAPGLPPGSRGPGRLPGHLDGSPTATMALSPGGAASIAVQATGALATGGNHS